MGGRVQTKKNDKGEPLFNDFAWRVGEGNHRMLSLAKVRHATLKGVHAWPRGKCLVRASLSCRACSPSASHPD